jgi:hypothetical protein
LPMVLRRRSESFCASSPSRPVGNVMNRPIADAAGRLFLEYQKGPILNQCKGRCSSPERGNPTQLTEHGHAIRE